MYHEETATFQKPRYGSEYMSSDGFCSLQSHKFSVEQNKMLPQGFDEQQVVQQHLAAGYSRCVRTPKNAVCSVL